MRGLSERLHDRFGGPAVRSDAALAVGLSLATVMVLVVIVAVVVAVARIT